MTQTQLDLKELESKTSAEFVSKVKYQYELLTKCLHEGRTLKVKVMDDFHNYTVVFLTDGANCHVFQISEYGTIDYYNMPIYYAREFVNQLNLKVHAVERGSMRRKFGRQVKRQCQSIN